MLRFLVQALLILLVFIVAWRTGGKPERYVASIYLGMFAAAALHALAEGPDGEVGYLGLHSLRFALDIVALFVVVYAALRFDRWWTLWVGAVQLIAVMAHLLRIADWPIAPIAYAVMERWPVWLAVIFTGLGTYTHSRRSRANLTAI
jgi:hypothetical protein